jgi:hypothetical protein
MSLLVRKDATRREVGMSPTIQRCLGNQKVGFGKNITKDGSRNSTRLKRSNQTRNEFTLASG